MLQQLLPIFAILGAFLAAGPAHAAGAIVHDGDTIQLGDVTYRLASMTMPIPGAAASMRAIG